MTEPYLDPEAEINFALSANISSKEKLRGVLTIAYRLAKEKQQWMNLATALKESLDAAKNKQEVICGWCGEVFGVVDRANEEEKEKALSWFSEHTRTCAKHPAGAYYAPAQLLDPQATGTGTFLKPILAALTNPPHEIAKPKRIQRKRTRGWRMPEGAVYVGRPTKWGNPWTIEAALNSKLFYPEECAQVVVDEFEAWITGDASLSYSENLGSWKRDDMIKRRAEILAHLPELRGKDLACWCPEDQPCHADVLLRLANKPPV